MLCGGRTEPLLRHAERCGAGTPHCYDPGSGDSNDDAADQACFITTQLASILSAAQASGATDDTYLAVAGGPGSGTNGSPSLLQGAIDSILYKPNGGKFGSGPYITFYLNRDVLSNFCARWNQSVKPANFTNCDNYYGNHIVYHLR